MKFTFSHGLGDYFTIDSYMSPQERKSLTDIYHAFNNHWSDDIRELIETNPSLKHVKHHYLKYPTELLEGVHSSFADAGILHRKPFHGSSFLNANLTDVKHDLPDKFDFIQMHTPKNLPGNRVTRDASLHEWGPVIERLEKRDTVGLVINSDAVDEIPKHDRLIDIRGTTSLAEAIEILQRASGYCGIDSCFAILAVQIFKAKDLLIRCQNPHLVSEACVYYAPHETIDFLTPEFGKPRYPVVTRQEKPHGELVELKCNLLVGIRNYGRGERVEIPQDQAQTLCRLDKAIPYILED